MTTAYEGAVEAAAARYSAKFQGVTLDIARGIILLNLERRLESIEQGNPHLTPAGVLDWLENDPGTYVSEAVARLDEAQLRALANPPTTSDLKAEIDRLRSIDGAMRTARALGLN